MPDEKVRVTTTMADGTVKSNMPPPPEPPKMPTNEAQQVMQDAGLDNKTMQVLMALMDKQAKTFMEGVAELRKPSAEEAEEKDAKKKRLQQARLNAAAEGARVEATIKSEQMRCGHQKPDGRHTFRGQVHSDGWAEIKCIRCLLRFRVKPLAEHVANGMNLDQVPGLNVEHLKNWAKQSGEIERAQNAAALRQARLNDIRLDPATAGAPITGL